MKNKLNIILSLLTFSLFVCGQNASAQQGGLDTTFGTNNTGIYQDNLPALTNPADPVNISRIYKFSEVLADDRIIAAGEATKIGGGNNLYGDFVVRRLNADGSPDANFGTNGSVQTAFYRYGSAVGEQSNTTTGAMKVQPDGKIIVAGICRINGAPIPNDNQLGSDLCLIRYNQNGTLDTSFGGNSVTVYAGNSAHPPTTYTMEPGKVFTLTGTNTADNTSGGYGGTPVRIQVAPDGRIYVFGNSLDRVNPVINGSRIKGFVAVYSTSGALQSINSLISNGNGTDGYGQTQIYDGELLSNGDYIAVGSQTVLLSSNPASFSATRWKVFTGNSGGGFLDADTGAQGSARSITMLRSNKILIGGQTGGINQFGAPTIVRYNGDLTVDTTFGANGKIVYNGSNGNPVINGFLVARLKTQPDGKILATDSGLGGNLYRLNPNGSFDRSFGPANNLNARGVLPSGTYSTPFSIRGNDRRIAWGEVSFQLTGKLVTAGYNFDGNHAIVTRLKTSFRNGGTFTDFNNDGKAEVAVFRSGTWYYLDSFSNAFSGVAFGASTDKAVPADYDGDGKTDIAVYRPSSGIWYIYQSSNNQVRGVQFGAAEDLPRPGDFNGDGQADIAVFRPSNGTWYILYSNPVQPGNITFTAVAFGQSGDVPLLADFDGDGKSDIAVYRNASWFYLRSTDGGFRSVNFGASGDIPTVGDYDGDGQTDVSVFRPSNGYWYRLNSSNGAFVFNQFGQNGDKPVPADFDNDGKTDLAIFRSGTWYALRSADNSVLGTAFGTSTDIPVPAAYLP